MVRQLIGSCWMKKSRNCCYKVLRAVNKQGDLWALDKLNTSEDDVIDALRLCTNCLAVGRSNNRK
jgi:hypothetical protein